MKTAKEILAAAIAEAFDGTLAMRRLKEAGFIVIRTIPASEIVAIFEKPISTLQQETAALRSWSEVMAEVEDSAAGQPKTDAGTHEVKPKWDRDVLVDLILAARTATEDELHHLILAAEKDLLTARRVSEADRPLADYKPDYVDAVIISKWLGINKAIAVGWCQDGAPHRRPGPGEYDLDLKAMPTWLRVKASQLDLKLDDVDGEDLCEELGLDILLCRKHARSLDIHLKAREAREARLAERSQDGLRPAKRGWEPKFKPEFI